MFEKNIQFKDTTTTTKILRTRCSSRTNLVGKITVFRHEIFYKLLQVIDLGIQIACRGFKGRQLRFVPGELYFVACNRRFVVCGQLTNLRFKGKRCGTILRKMEEKNQAELEIARRVSIKVRRTTVQHCRSTDV